MRRWILTALLLCCLAAPCEAFKIGGPSNAGLLNGGRLNASWNTNNSAPLVWDAARGVFDIEWNLPCQSYTQTGTYTSPTGSTNALVFLGGPGAGGGGGYDGGYSGGASGNGGTAIGFWAGAQSAAAVTIGTGGAGGTHGTPGTMGGNCSGNTQVGNLIETCGNPGNPGASGSGGSGGSGGAASGSFYIISAVGSTGSPGTHTNGGLPGPVGMRLGGAGGAPGVNGSPGQNGYVIICPLP